MATVKFFTKGKGNQQTIYIRLRDGRQIDYSTTTGLTIDSKHWSKAKGWINPRSNYQYKLKLEDDLSELEKLILGERNNRIGESLPITKDWFIHTVMKWNGKAEEETKDNLIELIEAYKKHIKHRVKDGKKGVSAGTLRNYNTTISRIKRFQEHTNKVYRLVDVDLDFHGKFEKYITEDLGLAINSISKDISNLKAVANHFKNRGVLINEQVLTKHFSKTTEKTIFTTLNIAELELLKDFEGANYLENARDWLIIGCWTGCRVADLMELTKSNVMTHTSGAKIIVYTQNKTGKQVKVPMHDEVERIIEKNNGFPRPISTAKFNEYIKDVCRESGLTHKVYGSRQNPKTHKKEVGYFEKWQLIRSHCCRRSFATNHYNLLTNKQIMAVTGHKTEQMLLHYIGETEEDHVEDFLNLWNNKPTPTIKRTAK